MKWGILCRWHSFWIGAHWSPYNKRLCLNLIPFVTLWITARGGEVPNKGVDIYRSDREENIEAEIAESHDRKFSQTKRRKGTLMNCPIHAQVVLQFKKEEQQRMLYEQAPDIPFNKGSKVWIEAGNDPTRAAELRISLSEGVPTGHGDFWVPICSPDGEPMGWMRFGFITTMFGSTVFGASEWRPAYEPAPAERTMLPLPVNHVPEGFAPPL